MAANPHLVLAFFPSEETADEAAEGLRAWAKTNHRLELEAVGVLVKDDHGEIKTHKLGPRRSKKGAGIGIVLGAVAAVASGGITLVEGAAVGAVGGGGLGALFHKSLGVSEEDVARISSSLDIGHAAVGALVPANQAVALTEELEALGGTPEVHEVSPEDVPATGEAVAPTP